MKTKTFLLAIALVAIVVLYGCTQQPNAETDTTNTQPDTNTQPETNTQAETNTQESVVEEESGEELELPPPPQELEKGTHESEEPAQESTLPEWMTTEVTDVLSDKTYTLADFKGKPVLVESFAVWCPICTRQQQEIKKLHEEVGDDVISVALDTDPNEDAAIVKGHAQSNGFDWYYSVSPRELTLSLIDEFGNSIVNAPQAPVILICEDQTTKFLGRGVKSANDLKAAIAQGCSA